MEKLEKQPCPLCRQNKLTLSEEEYNIPHFGKTYLFSMTCDLWPFIIPRRTRLLLSVAPEVKIISL